MPNCSGGSINVEIRIVAMPTTAAANLPAATQIKSLDKDTIPHDL